jgi:hypothetical protein
MAKMTKEKGQNKQQSTKHTHKTKDKEAFWLREGYC